MKTQNNLIRFREIYTYLNEDTLKQALIDGRGELVLNMLREQLNSLATGHILMALGESLKAEYINLLWHYTNNSVPLIRESAYIALMNYPDEERPMYNYFLTRFKNDLLEESSEGVKQRLIENIEWLKDMENIS